MAIVRTLRIRAQTGVVVAKGRVMRAVGVRLLAGESGGIAPHAFLSHTITET